MLQTLDECKLARNTLVVFTSDNGGEQRDEANCGPTRGAKGSMYEGGLRVPTAMRWLGHIEPGSQSTALALSMDLHATALEAAGASPEPNTDGVSLLPILTGQMKDLAPRDVFFIRREGGPSFGGKTNDALIRGHWKLLQNTPFSPLEIV